MHLIRERYRSFQPLLIDEMMQGQRMARTGVSCYKPDVWAFEEVRCLRLVLLLSQLGTPHSDFPGPNSGITACVAVIRHKQLVVSNDAYNLSRDHKPDLEAEKERILMKAG
ncbi:unnamed protein product [Brassica napus]|uniref:(rape) hypothetical protein n=1 Tax=Brassica napus TaxID=3708 RepID=A0A816IP10_BRANA|nr:unnamed protein product [Brassica napus]